MDARQPLRSLSLLTTAAATLFAFAAAGPAAANSEPVPKNIIIFVADGWGFNQMEAASIYHFGWRGGQTYQRFPVRLANATFPYGGGYDPEQAWTDFDYFKRGATGSGSAATGTRILSRFLLMRASRPLRR